MTLSETKMIFMSDLIPITEGCKNSDYQVVVFVWYTQNRKKNTFLYQNEEFI